MDVDRYIGITTGCLHRSEAAYQIDKTLAHSNTLIAFCILSNHANSYIAIEYEQI